MSTYFTRQRSGIVVQAQAALRRVAMLVRPPRSRSGWACRAALALLAAIAVCAPAFAQGGDVNFECTTSHAASRTLAEFVAAYEANDLATLTNRLDPALIGYQRFIDGMAQDFSRQKQLRLHLKDVQMQCGPDVTVINVTWEKRFLELHTFQPGFLTGRMAILLHRNRDQWRLAAVGGDSPFGTAASGALADLTVAASVDISALSAAAANLRAKSNAAPVNLPFALSVVDADQAGRGGLQVVVTTSQGDRETFTLMETTPGRFTRASVPFTAAQAVPGDGALQVQAGATLTVRYADLNPGNNRPATVLTRSVRTTGSPVTIDTTPNPFGFVAVTNAAPGAAVASNPVTVSGIDTAVPIGITGGTYAVNGGAFTSAPGMVSNGAMVQVRVNASTAALATVTATLTIGGVSGTFSVTTSMADTTPDPFFFANAADVPPLTPTSSAPVTVSGINAPAPISVMNGSYSINGGPFVTSPGTIANGQNVVVQVTSSPNTSGGGSATATLTIGGVMGSFTATTYDTQPNGFAWPNAAACPVGTIDSAPVMITGLTGPAAIGIADGGGTPAPNALYSINGGPFTNAPGFVTNGQTVTLRVNRYGTVNALTVRALVTIGGVAGTWSTFC